MIPTDTEALIDAGRRQQGSGDDESSQGLKSPDYTETEWPSPIRKTNGLKAIGLIWRQALHELAGRIGAEYVL
jgi:hypothetical protein